MNWMRRGTFEILASVLLFSILGAVLFAGIFSAFGHPQKVKSWFNESGIYEQIVTNAITNAQLGAGSTSDATSVSLKDPLVQDTARQIFSGQYVQQNVETFIDSNYAWLQGTTKSPDFSINLVQPKQQFAQTVGDRVQAYLSSLGVCTNQQLAQLQANGPVNPLALACRPAQIDPKTESVKVAQEIATSEFIKQPVINAETIGSGYGLSNEQPYYKTFSVAPTAYKIGQIAPIVLVVIAAFAVLGLFITASDKRVALRRISFVSFVAGVILSAMKFVADLLVNKIQDRVLTNQNASELQKPITSIIHSAEQSLVRVNLYAGIVLLLISLALAIWIFRTRSPRASKTQSERPHFVDNNSVGNPITAPPEERPVVNIKKSRSVPTMDIRPVNTPRKPAQAPTPIPAKQGSEQQVPNEQIQTAEPTNDIPSKARPRRRNRL